jgi:hypothetical protein
MRFTFSGQADGSSLKTIPEIPDYSLCYLEGKNGIGKTLALHLLELATGQQPYDGLPAAWESLRRTLRDTTISINEADHAKQIQVRLTPQGWPESPAPVDQDFGSADIDGKPIPLSELGNYLRVFRVAGDETFEKTIRSRIEADAAVVERVRDRLSAQQQFVDSSLEVIDRKLASILPQRFEEERTRVASLRERLAALEEESNNHAEVQALLEDAIAARNRARAVTNDLPKLRARHAALKNKMVEIEDRQATLERERQDLQPSLARQQELALLIKSAEGRRGRHSTRLRNIEIEIARMGRELLLTPSRGELEAEAIRLRGSLLLHEAQLISLDVSQVVKEVAVEIEGSLNRTRGRGIDEEVIAEIEPRSASTQDTGVPIRVAELRQGVSRHRLALEHQEPATEIARLKALVSKEQLRQRQVEEALKLLDQRERTKELLAVAQQELDDLSRRMSARLADRYRKVVNEIQNAGDELRSVVVEEVGIRQQIQLLSGGRSIAELQDDVARALTRLGLSDDTGLDDMFVAHEAKGRAIAESIQSVRKDLDNTEGVIGTLEQEVRPTLREVLTDPRNSWTDVAGNIDEVIALPLGALLEFVGRLHDTSVKVRDDVGRLRDTLDSLEQALKATADAVGVRGPTATLTARQLGSEVLTVMARRLERDFNQIEIREALFSGGVIDRIDLSRLEVTWREADGRLQVKPFEAFSSGEQAFAYTRARIESVANIAAERKIVALDEFGAFLARDRLERLLDFLRTNVVGRLADQVILVLPLALDYPKQEQITTGPLKAEYARRAREVEVRGYFTVDASVILQ